LSELPGVVTKNKNKPSRTLYEEQRTASLSASRAGSRITPTGMHFDELCMFTTTNPSRVGAKQHVCWSRAWVMTAIELISSTFNASSSPLPLARTFFRQKHKTYSAGRKAYHCSPARPQILARARRSFHGQSAIPPPGMGSSTRGTSSLDLFFVRRITLFSPCLATRTRSNVDSAGC